MPQQIERSKLIADLREQLIYLGELGVETLEAGLLTVESRAMNAPAAVPVPVVEAAVTSEIAPVYAKPPESIIVERTRPPEPRPPAGSRLASLPSLSNRPAAAPRIEAAVAEQVGASEITPHATLAPDASAAVETILIPDHRAETILEIRNEIGPACMRCKLSKLGRTKVVNSVGNFSAELMFVGEAPGANEDEEGEPFVGRAGQLLTKIIESIGMTREEVFIGNINRCRPPGNRAPEPDETVACKPFLLREIAVVKPKVIVVLGATAAHNLLETKVPIGKLRGHFHDYQGTKVMPTFHPAYLLRDPHKKREVWEDMKIVRDYLGGTDQRQ